MKAKLIQKYINLYSHKIATQNALWQRYTNSPNLIFNRPITGIVIDSFSVIKKRSDVYGRQ
jgi:hypothetical protein